MHTARYGSDAIVDWIADAGIDCVALNPGATLRGLHDSLVRHASLRTVLALHEEIAVGIAHGYAKAAGKPMAVFLHDLVGLQHASMAIFNAFVDRVPILLIGGSGPRAEEARRPWLDWIHTGLPQGSLVRDFVKWDGEPATIDSLPHTLNRAMRMMCQEPTGPVYVSIDTDLQEQLVASETKLTANWSPPTAIVPEHHIVAEIAHRLGMASAPVVVVDRPVPGLVAHVRWLAEQLGAAVIDMGGGCNFPTTHWADQTAARAEALAEADLILTFEVRDVGFALGDTDTATREVASHVSPGTDVFAIGLSELRHRGFLVTESMPPGVRFVVGEAAASVAAIRQAVTASDRDVSERRSLLEQRHARLRREASDFRASVERERPIHPAHLAGALQDVLAGRRWQLANGLLAGWPRRLWDIEHEHAYLGRSAGEGLGYGLPASIGAALAHAEDDTFVVDIQADGDAMYVASALWTAAHEGLPLMIVVHNNGTYGKDETHQIEMARVRGRSSDVVPIGIRLDSPAIDFAGLARAHGVDGIGPCQDPAGLAEALSRAAEIVEQGRPVLVDVVCQ